MMQRGLLKSLWRDDRAGASVISLFLITAIVAMGGIVGLVAVRDNIVQQFGDVAVALDNLSQSFSYTIRVDRDGIPGFETLCGTASYSDPAATLTDPVNQAPACLTMNQAPVAEGVAIAAPTGAFP